MSYPILERLLDLDAGALVAQLAEVLDALPLGADAKGRGSAVAARLERMLEGRSLAGALDGEPLAASGPDEAGTRARLDALAAGRPDPGPGAR